MHQYNFIISTTEEDIQHHMQHQYTLTSLLLRITYTTSDAKIYFNNNNTTEDQITTTIHASIYFNINTTEEDNINTTSIQKYTLTSIHTTIQQQYNMQ